MPKKVKKAKRKVSKTTSRKDKRKTGKTRSVKVSTKDHCKIEARQMGHSVVAPTAGSPVEIRKDSRVFSIELNRISPETTIGDLIVVYPRTRDILMKRGLRFDVEDAGYIYMTLSVFSALHGLEPSGLIQELVAASKEVPQVPSQPLSGVAASPSA